MNCHASSLSKLVVEPKEILLILLASLIFFHPIFTTIFVHTYLLGMAGAWLVNSCHARFSLHAPRLYGGS